MESLVEHSLCLITQQVVSQGTVKAYLSYLCSIIHLFSNCLLSSALDTRFWEFSN